MTLQTCSPPLFSLLACRIERANVLIFLIGLSYLTSNTGPMQAPVATPANIDEALFNSRITYI